MRHRLLPGLLLLALFSAALGLRALSLTVEPPIADLGAAGYALRGQLPTFAGWAHEGGPDLFGLHGAVALLPLLAAFLFCWWSGFFADLVARYGATLLIGGSLFNNLEALATGRVIDYFWLPAIGRALLIPNLPDLAIMVGLFMLVGVLVRNEVAAYQANRRARALGD